MGTWLNAAIYCSEQHSSLLIVFNQLNAEYCASVATCRSLLSDYSLANELAFIDSNFKILLKFIDLFQKTGLSISSALNELEREFDLLSDKFGKNVQLMLKETLSKNVDLLKIRHFNAIINGHESNFLLEDCKHSPNEIAFYKFAPLVSCEVERQFSAYKYILSDRRESLHFDNLAKVFSIYCNSHLHQNL